MWLDKTRKQTIRQSFLQSNLAATILSYSSSTPHARICIELPAAYTYAAGSSKTDIFNRLGSESYLQTLFIYPVDRPVHLLGKTACLQLEGTIVLFIYWGWQLAFSSKARCLRVSKTERYGLSRFCFEMTRQATKTRWRQVVFLSRWTTQLSSGIENRALRSYKPLIYNIFSSIVRVFSLPSASFQNKSYWDRAFSFGITGKRACVLVRFCGISMLSIELKTL
jgi:hypothetical protein